MPEQDPQRPGRQQRPDSRLTAGVPPASSVLEEPVAYRTWILTLPAGMELLNSNDRDGHWARRKRVTKALREAAGWLARDRQIPPLQRAHILAVYEPPDRRRRDPGNLYPSFKACIDGIVDAGILPNDDAKHLDGPDPRLGGIHPRGRLVLHITELP